jgi:HEAT repeat protein/DNA-binding beta-propeller fold protein YncE
MKRMTSLHGLTRFLTLFIVLSPFCVATLSSASSAKPAKVDDLRKQLKAPSATVRKQAALKLAEANDADAIPILIDLLAELPANERRPIEEFLTWLAGELAPVGQLASEERLARKIHRDAWMVWWRDSDGPALLAAVRDHTLTPELRLAIKQHIGKLGDDDFSIREAAMKDLLHLGRRALPELGKASKGRDLEATRRARQLIEQLERQPRRDLPAAVVRLLVLRKPTGVMEALLDYFPFAEEENRTDEVKNALAVLALRDGKIDAALVRALADDLPERRIVAAEAMIQGGGKLGRQAVRKLLHDNTATVRLPVALALAHAGDKDAVPVLIDLLAVLPNGQAGYAEETLVLLAGDKAPEMKLGTMADERAKRRDIWADWWKTNAHRVEMTRLTEGRTLGLTVVCVCESQKGRVYEIDRRGKQLWCINNLNGPVDAVVIPGNRVLMAEYHGGQVSERDLKGNILWKKNIPNALSVQRLANGNTFIASQNRLLELNRDGKEIYSISNLRFGIDAAYRSRQGPIVCLTNSNQCVLMDTSGKQLKSFASVHGANNLCVLDVTSNDRILVVQRGKNKMVEFDKTGKLLRERDVPEGTTVTGLPNGNLLVASHSHQRIYELDRQGKVVWEHKNAGQIIRARRR